MPPDHRPTPAKIIGELLTDHPEAPSLLAEACHCRALADCSAVVTRLKLAALQAARLAYEELRHRLEPRRRRPVHFGVGLLLLLVLGAGAAVLLGLLLVALDGSGLHPGWPAGRGPARGSTVFGVLTGAVILVLAAGAAVLVAQMEPAGLLPARRRWHRALTAHEAAVATEQADIQAAAVATAAWLGLVRAWVTGIAADDEPLVRETMALAALFVESGRPQLPPPL